MKTAGKILDQIRIYNRWASLPETSVDAVYKACCDENVRLQYTIDKSNWTDIDLEDLNNGLEFDRTYQFRTVPNIKYIPFTIQSAINLVGKFVYHPEMGRFKIKMIGNDGVLADRYLDHVVVREDYEISYESLLSFILDSPICLPVGQQVLDRKNPQITKSILHELYLWKHYRELSDQDRQALEWACHNPNMKIECRLKNDRNKVYHWTIDSICNIAYLPNFTFGLIPETKYRPFTPKEAVDYLEKEIVYTGEYRGDPIMITCVDPKYIWTNVGRMKYSDLLDKYKFVDGSPCGVKIS